MAKKAAALPDEPPEPKKTKRKTQQFMPGTEPQKIPKVHDAAVEYADCRDAHKTAKREMDFAHDRLLTAMQGAGINLYVFGDITVRRDVTEACKVKIKSTSEADEKDSSEE